MFDVRPFEKEIGRLCGQFGIKRLEFFGSVLTDDFDKSSDIDCLIEFDESEGSHFHRYFDFKDALEELFDREVDVVVGSAMRNPYFKAEVESTKKLVYVA
ncbi:MAG: nucleotidyltransferase domain-containing protein [Pyrinomonadaceae bacterium]|nr:nucleotidyltransferase domain-containing protein [Chloracidobacterium sp.]